MTARVRNITRLAKAVVYGKITLTKAQNQLADPLDKISLLARVVSVRKGLQSCRRINR